jgi:hypothetical protein
MPCVTRLKVKAAAVGVAFQYREQESARELCAARKNRRREPELFRHVLREGVGVEREETPDAWLVTVCRKPSLKMPSNQFMHLIYHLKSTT